MFSRRVTNLDRQAAPIYSIKAQRGEDIISLTSGESDFGTPHNIKRAAKKAIDDGHTKYTEVSGLLELRQAICNKFYRDNGLTYDPSQVTVGCGAKNVIFNAVLALIDEGDEVIVPSPCWRGFVDQIQLAGGTPIFLESAVENSLRITPRQLKDALSRKTKLVFFNNPCNPTGVVYSRDELQALADILSDTGAYVISDEIFEKILYEDAEHISIAGLNETLRRRTLVVNGVSKAYAMAGWRIGYGAGHEELIAVMNEVQHREVTNACSIAQYAALEALSGPQDGVGEMRRTFEKRRDVLAEGLNGIGWPVVKPEGTLFLWASIPVEYQQLGSTAFALKLRKEARVAVSPGVQFGTAGEGYVRISLVEEENRILEAVRSIGQALF